MKVDTNRLKKGTSEVPSECQILIDKLKLCGRHELRNELKNIETWTFGKCELYHWIDVLDIFDTILEEAAEIDDDSEWILAIDDKFSNDEKELVILVLNFTTLLIEHSFSRHLYNSVENLITLLQSNDLDVVLVVLNLLYMFSKRSNFISRVNAIKKHTLLSRVGYLAESWGGKEQGFGLADCCQDKQFADSPYHTQYFEIVSEHNKTERISLSELKKINSDPRMVAEYVCQRLGRSISSDQKIHVYTRIRAALYFTDRNLRLKFVQARLQALSILVYSNFALINPETHLYPGFMEELVDLLQIENLILVEIQAAALRTLTSIIHLDRNPHFPKKPGSRLFTIIDVTGASSYHGFLPGLVRTCILHLINPPESRGIHLFPMTLATSLFSFLYHLASYEAGGEALVASGMMDSLLKVINWPGTELEHITFVTRAVRVIDLITNIDMVSFQNYGGLFSFIKRLEMEIDICRTEQPNEITTTSINTSDQEMVVDQEPQNQTAIVESEQENNTSAAGPNSCSNADKSINAELLKKLKDQIKDLHSFSAIQDTSVMSKNWQQASATKMCLPQRAALLKSMLNFLKKAIQDATFAESIRHVMEGGLPKSLQHIISNAEYYGPSLFLLATDVVTVYVFQEPSLLSYLQDIGLTDVILQALLKKDVPATREVLGSLPNVFSALCLNSKGLEAFVKFNPFYKLFRVLLSPKYLSAMRRRRSSDPMGDTASNLGNAMDELMRHQPSLRLKATKAVIRLLQELVYFGTDPQFICWRAQNKSTDSPSSPKSNANSNSNISSPNPNSGNTDAGSSDDDDDDDDEEEEEEASTSSTAHQSQQQNASQQPGTSTTNSDGTGGTNERIPIPLIDYILNIMKFVDAILSNNSTNDHCIEFINEGGLTPLLSILALPNLPIDSPITASAQSVAAVYKSIMNLSHDSRVLRYALEDLADVVEKLKPLTGHLESPGGSVLLRELANCPSIEGAFSSATYTPLLHAMSAVHGYVVMLVHVCRSGQFEVRHMSLHSWGGNTRYGIKLLKNLVQLYTALVWESTLLLALCTDDIIPPGCDFAREDMEKLVPDDFRGVSEITWDKIILNNRRVGVAKIVETLENGSMEFETSAQTTTAPSTSSTPQAKGSDTASQNDDQSSMKRQVISPTPAQLRYIKALLGASSRLGRALAELFGLLVKLCVGAPFRQRRQNFQPTPHTNAKEIARVLSHILVDGLSFEKLPPSPIPKLKLTFLICSVGFTSPMLFDDKRYAYHLMLEKFVDEGGLVAFFRMFKWALTRGGQIQFDGAIENPDLPDGTGEFLDSWLVLLDKLSNPRAILDSPHIMSSSAQKNRQNMIPPTVSEFDCINYLKNIHSLAYSAIQYIWGYKPLKIYGVRMTESVLSILRHIIRGEGIIKLRLEERNKEVSTENVMQLMDMGFPKKTCEDALERAGGVVETATEILLSAEHGESTLEAEANVSGTVNTSSKAGNEATNSTSNSGNDQKSKDEFVDMHLTSEMLDQFTEDAILATIRLLDELPESVYRVCDLVIAIIQRNGSSARDNILTIYVAEIHEFVLELLKAMKDINKFDEICSGELAKKAAVRIHLFTLLFEGHCSDEMRVPCASALHRHGVMPILLNLLTEIEKMMTKYVKLNSSKITKKPLSGNSADSKQQTPTQQGNTNTSDSSSSSSSTTNEVNITPKWLAPLFLLIDFYQKIAEITQNRYAMHRATSRVWKWYDLSTGRWNPYSDTANKAINEAYWGGQPVVRVTGGRQRYSISFNCMTQVNEETGTHRPVILSLKSYEKYEKPDRTIKRPNPIHSSPSSSSSSSTSSSPSSVASATSGASYLQKLQPGSASTGGIMFAVDKTRRRIADYEDGIHRIECENVRILPEIICKIPILKRAAIRDVVLASVGLMKLPIDRDTLHAVMRVCLRFTRDYEMAKLFGSEGGIKILLSLNQDSSYLGFITLATLLIRHTFEEPTTLKVAIEQVLLSRTLPSLPPGYKELIYLARQMGAAVLRQPDIWVDASRELLRIDVNLLRSPSLVLPDDNRLFVKSSLNFNLTVKRDCWLLSHVIQDLMISLVDYDFKIIDQNTVAGDNMETDSSKNSSIFDKFNLSIDMSPGGNQNQDSSNIERIEEEPDTTTNEENIFVENQNNCILSKSAILKILAAAVRSYYSVAVEIVEFTYTPENCPIFTEKMSSLSYILDYLLPIMITEKDRDCSSSAKLVIASIASSTDCRILNIVATEVRNALNRALSLPESKIKHSRIQLLCEVIQTMIESCPVENPSNPIDIEFQAAFPVRSTLFFIMHRRHILTDLARASQSIDLTSPGALNTINAILEPLETLIRLSNQPSLLATNSSGASTRSRATMPSAPPSVEMTLSTTPVPSPSTSTTQLQENREEQSTSSGGSTVSVPVSTPAPTTSSQSRTHILLNLPPEPQIYANLDEMIDDYLDRNSSNENVNIADDQPISTSTPRDESILNQSGRSGSVGGDAEPPQAPVVVETSSESGGDSDSNQTDNDERDMEEVENDEENDEDEEEEERSEMDVDEETRQYIEFYGQHNLSPNNGQQNANADQLNRFRSRMSPNLLERGQDDILMIQFTPDPNAGGGGNAIQSNRNAPNPGTSASLNNLPAEHAPIGRYVFPVSDELMSGVGVAPTSGNVADRMPSTGLNTANQTNQNQGTIASHPLLMGRSSSSHGGSSNLQANNIHTDSSPPSNARNQLRPSSTRQRRYQYFNFNSRNLSQTPVILQRLLGPPSAQTENNTSAAVAAQAFRDATRVVLMDNNGLGFFSSRNGEESVDEVVDHAGYLFGRSLAARLNQTPTALHWWTEEAKILGSESQSDVCLLACDQLIPDLIKVRQMDGAELNSKKKKRSNDDTSTGGKEKQAAIGSVNATVPTGRMDTSDSTLVPMVVLPEASFRSIMSSQRGNNSNRENLPASENSIQNQQDSGDTGEYLLPRSDICRTFNLSTDTPPTQISLGSGESGPSNPISSSDESNRIHSNISSSAEEEEEAQNQEISDINYEGEMQEGELQVSFESASDEIDEIMNLHQSNEGAGEGEEEGEAEDGDEGEDDGEGGSSNVVLGDNEDTQPFIPTPCTPPYPPPSRGNEDTQNNLNSGGRANNEWTPLSSSSLSSFIFHQLRADAEQMLEEHQDDDAEEDNDDEDEDEEEDDEEDEGDGDDDDEEDEDGAVGGDGDEIPSSNPLPRQQTNQANQVLDDALRSILGDIEIPDGVDPSFLAALPDEMRAEVLNEHMRMQRNRQRTEQQEQDTAAAAVQSESAIVEVNPEFLAALPPNIQEEVLAQQRIELQRQAAATTNPEDPVDAAAFFQNLNPTLRQAILTDMEESQISVLPPELAAEAQTLRQNWEVRNRQLMQDRLLTQITSSSASSSIPSVLRYRRQNAPRTRWSNWNSNSVSNEAVQNLPIQPTHLERLSPLLDHESIASILVLIFKIDTRFYHLRLQRIIRQLCVHIPTRDWIIRSLISILHKCNTSCTKFNPGTGQRPTWLGIKVDPSICSTANIFNLTEKYPNDKKITDRLQISIHPQSVAPISCEVLDQLIAIAKIYPTSFLATLKIRVKSTPQPPANHDDPLQSKSKPSSSSSSASSSPLSQTGPNNESDDFWDIILQLDYNSHERLLSGSNAFGPYSNTQRRPRQINQAAEYTTFHETPFGKLIPMLNQCRNNYISDKLLRLLSLISVGFLSNRDDKDKSNQTKNRLYVIDPALLPGTDDLRIIVNTLTNTTNSEEGLEDATNLILNTSKCTSMLRIDIYDLLIESVKNLAKQVEERIVDLMQDVIALNRERQIELSNIASTSSSSSSLHYGGSGGNSLLLKGSLRDRFTHETVVISSSGAATKKTVCDIHLPTMGPLTSKSSCQAIFLGLLNVINQIRENPIKAADVKESADKTNKNDECEKEHYSMTAPLSEVLQLNVLWATLSECLNHLEQTADHHAVLVLQPAVEAFFLVHATKKDNPPTTNPVGASTSGININRNDTSNISLNESTGGTNTSRNRLSLYNLDDDDPPPLSPIVNQDDSTVGSDQKKFLGFAEKHRTVLNQILRQSQTHLSDGPFACLTDHARILDFDVKRRYFRTELERLDEGVRREELAVHVRRITVFEDSFKELYRRQPEEWKNRFYIVFEEEEGQDAGGLLREWYVIISREIFNPMYALFTVSPGDRVTYMINSSSHANPNHLCYYKFVGRVIAKAIYDNKLLECYFTRSFYKHILGIKVKYTDMESEDYEFYQGLVYLMENHVSTLGYEVTFSLEVNEFGVTSVRDIIPNGRNITVTEENKLEYIQRVCQLKMSGSIRHQLNAFLEGFYDIIPKRLISIFNEQELELLISGLPNIDIEDLRINTEYHKYQPNSIQIQWFWRALRSFDQAERAKFLQFVTGTSKVPLQGFAALEGMNGTQKFQIHRDDRSTERLPSAHTCFNQLDLPVYKTFDKLRCSLLKAIHECSEGFGFA